MRDLIAAGELNVDIIMSGIKQAPEFGLEILCDGYRECLGSSTAICACVAANLGLSTAFIGKLGTDAKGVLCRDTLASYGIDTSLLDIRDTYQTGVTVSMSSSVDRAMVTYFGDTIDILTGNDIDLDKADARHLHVGSLFLQTRLSADLCEVFRKAKAKGMTTSLDAGWDDTGRWGSVLGDTLRYTDFFFPNEKEAEALTGESDPAKAAVLLAARGTNAVVKCGSRGAVLCRAGETEVVWAAPLKTTVVDTTGAGDSFNAGFLYAFLKGCPLEDCMAWGNATGAVSVTRIGGTTDCPTLARVEKAKSIGVAEV